MASSPTTNLIGIALIICGIGLAYWGYGMSGGFASKLNNVVTGSDSNDVLYRYISGAVSFIIGILLLKK